MADLDKIIAEVQSGVSEIRRQRAHVCATFCWCGAREFEFEGQRSAAEQVRRAKSEARAASMKLDRVASLLVKAAKEIAPARPS